MAAVVVHVPGVNGGVMPLLECRAWLPALTIGAVFCVLRLRIAECDELRGGIAGGAWEVSLSGE
jgi:hypothetical protein